MNGHLKPGVPELEIVDLDFREPPVTPFKKATVQIKIVEDFENNWLGRQPPFPAAENKAKAAAVKTWVDSVKGPLSPVFTLTADDSDTAKFESVFGIE